MTAQEVEQIIGLVRKCASRPLTTWLDSLTETFPDVDWWGFYFTVHEEGNR